MTEAQLSTAVIENPEMLKYQRRQQQQQLDQKSAVARETGSAASVTGVVNGESLEDIRKVRAWPKGTENTAHDRDRAWGTGRLDRAQTQVVRRWVCAGPGVGPRGEPAWAHLAHYLQLREVAVGIKPPLSKAFLPMGL